MPNPNPRTDQLQPSQFRGLPGQRITAPTRVRLPLELAPVWEALTLEQRSALVVVALESLATPEEVTP